MEREDTPTPTPLAVAPHEPSEFWSRFRITFGPALVGLTAGVLTLGPALAACGQLLKNCASTYAAFPSVQPPSLARDFEPPAAVLVPLVALGILAPFAMGLVTAWLVRGRDRWSEVSAGLTTALVGSAAAYVVGIGWAFSLAMVVVPSLADLTLLGDATKAPAADAAAPSDVLVQRYPDLGAKPADERGGVLFAKIVADQATGSAYGIWLGVVVSLTTVGGVGFTGTFVGGWLLRRDGSWRAALWPYFEVTVTTSIAAGRLVERAVASDTGSGWFGAVCLLALTALVVNGVVRRWDALLRATLAVTWVLVLFGAGLGGGDRVPAAPAYLVYALLGALLFRRYYRPARPVVAPT